MPASLPVGAEYLRRRHVALGSPQSNCGAIPAGSRWILAIALAAAISVGHPNFMFCNIIRCLAIVARGRDIEDLRDGVLATIAFTASPEWTTSLPLSFDDRHTGGSGTSSAYRRLSGAGVAVVIRSSCILQV